MSPVFPGKTIWLQSQTFAAAGTAWEIDINTAGTFTLLSSGTVDVDVYWGDGDIETVTTNSVDHTYPAPGTYTIGIILNSGDFRPYYNNNAAGDELVTLGDTPAGWSFGTNLTNAFFGSANLTTIGDIDTSSVTNFSRTWEDCTGLTSFPLIDTSSVTIFYRAWYRCSGLTTFPQLDTSSGTRFNEAWINCNNLTSFPLIDTSLGTTFSYAWLNCGGMTTFPANFFDSWTGTPATNCFVGTWDNCPSLTATSVENILNSIDTSGQSGPGSGFDITIDYNAGTGAPNITTAVTNLKGRGWTITLNGVAQ